MSERPSHIHIAIAADMASLLDAALPDQSCPGRQRPGHVTIVTGGDVAEAIKSALAVKVAGSERTDVIDVTATLPRLLSDLRIGRSRRVPVDVDETAPRLREIRLPREIVDADYLLAAVDLRSDPRLRPDIVLGLWAKLASPVHRFGARISGPREGLTAELALGRMADKQIVFDRLAGDGPLIMLHGADPVAIEVIALAFRQVRSNRSTDTPGPWEDPLVQRATELNLGASGPVEVAISVASLLPETLSGHHPIIERIEAAASRAGIDQLAWERY